MSSLAATVVNAPPLRSIRLAWSQPVTSRGAALTIASYTWEKSSVTYTSSASPWKASAVDSSIRAQPVVVSHGSRRFSRVARPVALKTPRHCDTPT